MFRALSWPIRLLTRVLGGDLQWTEVDRSKHLDGLGRLQDQAVAWRKLSFLYENLNILDGKSASLLQFNAISLAFMALIAASESDLTDRVTGLLVVAVTIAAFSSLMGLVAARIWWARTTQMEDSEKLLLDLMRTRDRRTLAVRLAWWTAGPSFALAVVAFLLTLI